MVEEDDQFTHMIRLDGEYKEEMMLNVFKKDDDFLTNEKQYEDIKREILGESDASDSDDSSGTAFHFNLQVITAWKNKIETRKRLWFVG